MRARAGRAALLTAAVAVTLTLAGCAGRRLDNGVYRSEHGYRVVVPGPAWSVVDDSRAELELRNADGRAGMLVTATCDRAAARRRPADLERHLLIGLRDRERLEHGDVSLAGRRGTHVLVEGRMRQSGQRVRVEGYTVRDDRCVYDLLYVAPPALFDAWRGDFVRFVQSFAAER